MNLPIYQLVPVKNADLFSVTELLNEDINLRRPVAFVLTSLKLDEQREVVGVIENWFHSHQASWRFPYPVYLVSDLTEGVGNIPVVKDTKNLPKFFNMKDTKITVKESQVIDRNKLIQQEIKNADPHQMTRVLEDYGINHKKIWFLVNEGFFYEYLLNRLKQKKQNG